MKTLRALSLAAAAAAILVVAGCSTLEVSTDYDKAADFTKYRTYKWGQAEEIKNTIVKKRIEAAVDRQLASKGLKKVESGPDLAVFVHPRLSKETQINTYSTGWGYGYGWYGGMGTTTSTVQEIPVGTLVVDLVDMQKKELVWRGIAKSQLDSEASAEQRQERLDEAMQRLFESYPPKGK